MTGKSRRDATGETLFAFDQEEPAIAAFDYLNIYQICDAGPPYEIFWTGSEGAGQVCALDVATFADG